MGDSDTLGLDSSMEVFASEYEKQSLAATAATEASSKQAPNTNPESSPANTSPICEQGPCIHYVTTKTFVAETIASVQSHCRAGVVFVAGASKAKGVAKILTEKPILPVQCSHWTPWSDEEISDLEDRRIQAQERMALDRKAEAERDVVDSVSAPEIAPVDPGASILATAPIPLPDSFDELFKETK